MMKFILLPIYKRNYELLTRIPKATCLISFNTVLVVKPFFWVCEFSSILSKKPFFIFLSVICYQKIITEKKAFSLIFTTDISPLNVRAMLNLQMPVSIENSVNIQNGSIRILTKETVFISRVKKFQDHFCVYVMYTKALIRNLFWLPSLYIDNVAILVI